MCVKLVSLMPQACCGLIEEEMASVSILVPFLGEMGNVGGGAQAGDRVFPHGPAHDQMKEWC